MNNEKYKEWLCYNDEETRPVSKEIYLQYFEEGRKAFLDCLDPNKENNPYGTDGEFEFEGVLGTLDNLFYKGYPWFDGFRAAAKKYFETKYKIPELQEKIKELVKEHGLILEYSDEYGDPYIKTKEGYIAKIC